MALDRLRHDSTVVVAPSLCSFDEGKVQGLIVPGRQSASVKLRAVDPAGSITKATVPASADGRPVRSRWPKMTMTTRSRPSEASPIASFMRIISPLGPQVSLVDAWLWSSN